MKGQTVPCYNEHIHVCIASYLINELIIYAARSQR